MSPLSLALLIFGIMLVCMAIRVPIAVSMFAAGAAGYVMQTGWGPFANFLNAQAFARFASYDLSVIPLFILMGHFATQGGISKALFQFAAGVMGGFKGWPVLPLAPSVARRSPRQRPSPGLPCQR
jgi:TRAP-type mannitol/chloroaromatic compound transport system permease large subunit